MASYFTIIIPWQDRGEEDRRKAFDFAVDYYAMLGCEVVIGDDGHEGPLNRSKLRNAGAAKAKGSVFVFIDADTLVPFDQINQAVRQVGLSGSAVLPYNIGCTYLDQARTEAVYQAGPGANWRRLGIDVTTNWSYIGPDGQIPEELLVGPAIAVSRVAFQRLNGFHEGFVGWGEEERDFLYRMWRSYGVEAVPGGTLGLYHRTSNPEHQPAYRQGTAEQALFLSNRRLFLQRKGDTGEDQTPSITCPVCGRTSSHPTDIAEGWCGKCNDYTSRPSDLARAARRESHSR